MVGTGGTATPSNWNVAVAFAHPMLIIVSRSTRLRKSRMVCSSSRPCIVVPLRARMLFAVVADAHDAPVSLRVQRTGSITSFPILDGLHHCYARV
jgi:hypothetical protein